MTKASFLSLSMLGVLTGCSSGPSSPGPEEEHCTLAFEGSFPEWDVELVYDVQLRTLETDPGYDTKLGSSTVFTDGEGISIFTLTSFIRTTLSGEILLRKPVEGIRVKDVKSGNGVYGALLRYGDFDRFCIIPKDGTFDFDRESCVGALGELGRDAPFAWVAPYFHILGQDQREQMHSLTRIDTSGVVAGTANVLPFHNRTEYLSLEALGDDLVMSRQSLEIENGEPCEMLAVASVPTTGPAGPFVSIVPEHYNSDTRRSMVAGPTSTAIRHDVRCAVGGRAMCDSPDPPRQSVLLTMIDHATGTPLTKPFEIASNLIWDGENFVSFGIGGDEFHINLFSSVGEPVGYGHWPLGFGVEAIAGTGFAAIAPNDYVLTFHAAPLASQERLIRVKIAPK